MTQLTSANSPAVSLQDPGTGVTGHNDPNSAAHIGGALSHIAWGVLNGLSISGDQNNSNVTVSSGVALIENPQSASVQTTVQGSYNKTWHGQSVLPVSINSTTVPWDTSSGENHIYLDVDPTADNSVDVVVSSTQNPSELGNASLYLGYYDAGANSVSEPRSRYYSDKPLRSDNGYITNLSGDSATFVEYNNVYIVETSNDWDYALSNITARQTLKLALDGSTTLVGGDTISTPIKFVGANSPSNKEFGFPFGNNITIDSACTLASLHIGDGSGSSTSIVVNQPCNMENITLGDNVTLDLQADGCQVHMVSGGGTINNGSGNSNNMVSMTNNITFTGDTTALNTNFTI